MKTLIVTSRYAPEIGAAPTRWTNMANGLADCGDEVDVLTALPNYPKGRIFEGYRGRLFKKEPWGKCTVYRYWTLATISKNPIMRGISMIAFATMLWGFAFRRRRIRQYDRVIIQTPQLITAGSAMMLFKGLYGKKVFLNVSDIWPLSAVVLGAMREGSTIYKVFAGIERYVYRKADGIIGQSDEILEHVAKFPNSGKLFRYRNLKPMDISVGVRRRGDVLKVVYAGLLGVAQDILGIIEHVDFKEMGVEMHIYGGGKQKDEVERYAAEHDCNVTYHGMVSKEQMTEELRKYDASLIPLAVRIEGAVPSKIFDILPMGMPVVFCGGGEGARIIEKNRLGYTSEPGDYDALKANLRKMADMTDEEYAAMSARCLDVSRNEFDFDKQIWECWEYMRDVLG